LDLGFKVIFKVTKVKWGHSRSKIKFDQKYILLHSLSQKIGAKLVSLMVWAQSDVKHFIYNAFLINCHHKNVIFLEVSVKQEKSV